MQSLVGLAQSPDSAINGTSLQTSPYQLSTGRDLRLLGVGAATGITSLILESQVNVVTADEVARLNRANISSFDRQATYEFSPRADRLSDVTLAGNAAMLGLITLGTKPMRQELKTVAVMYIETLLLANGVQRSVKNITQRIRPYAYNPNVPLDEKLDRSTRQSFFSGHATNAFATAVFTSEVFRHYFPQSRLKPVVWVGSLGLASATAALRYKGGEHYPSDLLAAAAFGSLIGWGIPKLHEVKNKSELGRRLDVQPWSNSLATGVYVRLEVR
ncbi:phosphatase PAP2 family protein [Spirosoma soli]|uniref:Phosphatase PAP2 family protein n=1 Tax=Spirosoma soli TaxID=1770529 RepID=A0ABW5M509_9BACT